MTAQRGTAGEHTSRMPSGDDVPGLLRLADLLAALSLETDLGMGHPPEEAIRTCLLATGLARRLAFPENVVADVYWTSLLMHVGCTGFAHEQAAMFGGDEIRVNEIGSRTDFVDPREATSFLLELTRSMPAHRRARLLFAMLARGARHGHDVAVATCEVANAMGRRLELPVTVQHSLLQLFERWDGKGEPRKLAGDAISPAARLAELAAQATVHERLGGVEVALELTRRRSGAALDPGLVRCFLDHGRELLAEIEAGDPWVAVLDAEPEPRILIPETRLDEVARAFGDAVDLKSTFTLGHSSGVAVLTERACRLLGLPEVDGVRTRRAALLHDLGRVGIPNGIWEKDGPLTSTEWEQVRLHPYHTERILTRSTVLAPLATLAGSHHERLDGSGYHRGSVASGLGAAARVLAAADAFQAMTQTRAYRPALTAGAAADALAREVAAGRFDSATVDAVLAAAGQRTEPRELPGLPAGLTEREVEVLRLLARGHTNKQMGRQLFISPKTVGSHVEHIYQKLGVSSRAAAAMFAVEHDLLDSTG
jgi:HD-GYP domain-containing protein (c-di-GMP phosphodiesterase class II)